MTYADPAERRDLISGLRALADFLEDSPEIPAPYAWMCLSSRRMSPTRTAGPRSTA